MPRVMMTCTRSGKSVFTGLDLPLDASLGAQAAKTVQCPSCGRTHPLRKLYFEGTGPKEKHLYNVALESAPAFSAEIGVLISCFALVEGYMPHLMSRLTGIDKDDAFTILGRFQMGERIQLLGALASSRDGDNAARKALEILLPKLTAATAVRNKYVHAQYSITFNDAIIVESWLHDSKRKTKPKTTEDIPVIAAEVEKIQVLICDLHGYVYRDEMPSP
jgi:hypothetical protein